MKTFEKLKIRPVNVKDLRSARSYYREYDPMRLTLDDIRLGDIVYLRGYKGNNNYPWIVVDGITVKNIMPHASPPKNNMYLITSKSSKDDPYTTRKHNIVLQTLLFYNTWPAYEIPNDEYDVVRVYVPDENVRKIDFNNTHEFIEYIDDISDILNYEMVSEKLKIKPVSVDSLKDVKIVVNILHELQYHISKRILHHGPFCSLNNIDVSHITNMSFLFKVFKEFDGDVSDWDVSNVEDMSYMFFCTDFTGKTTDFSKWDISNVRDMRYMFTESKLSSNLSSWAIPKDCVIKNMLLRTNLETVKGERFLPKIQS